MGNKLLLMVGMFIAAAMFVSCGGSSSGSGEGGGGEGGGGGGVGVATVDSLSSIPPVDLSQYDSSASTSANLAAKSVKSSLAAKSVKSAGVSKAFGQNMKDVGGASRAGCEFNMHKQEVFRMSQMAQLERCYPEAMEKVGLIAAIPTGSYAYYRIAPPDMGEDQKTGMCDGIPAERERERSKCIEESQKSGSQKTMLMRIGKIDNQLHIDMCQGDPASQVNSSTYGASGSLYTADVVRIGEFGGERESGAFSMGVDIGSNGRVADGVVTMGDNGYARAAGQVDGRFGGGNILFERAIDSSVKLTGAFAGAYTDPFSNTATSFTGKTYAHVAGAAPITGCAKFSFTGTTPAIMVKDMIPFNISAANLASFLQTFGAQLGITLTEANYQTVKLCPNPNFDPNNFDPTIKPMIVMSGESCGSVTHAETECFSVTNASTRTDFGTETSQAFAIIANASAAYYAEVNAFDLSTVTPTIGAIAFTRAWDCSGTFTDINFASVARDAVETEMRKCFAIEEKARGNAGMGNEGQCSKGEQMNSVNKIAEDGGGADTFGAYGGEYSRTADGTCERGGAYSEKLFVNSIDDDTYCLADEGSCREFTVVNGVATTNIEFTSIAQGRLTEIEYDTYNPPANAIMTYTKRRDSCTVIYSINRPQFNAPSGDFGGGGGGVRPGEQGFIPQPCIDAGLTGPDQAKACGDLCMKPGTNCRLQ